METPNIKKPEAEITREDVKEGRIGGISTEKADQIFKEVETLEARDARIEELKKDIETKAMPAETMVPGPTGFKPKQEEEPATSELSPGTPVVFQRLPEISSHVTELMNSINGDVKGIKKLTSFFTKGYNKDVLELAEKGARKVLNNPTKMEIYRKALEQGGSKLAWEYVQESASNDYLDVVDGKIVEKSITKSNDFRGSSSE